jgi:hypothetical protein
MQRCSVVQGVRDLSAWPRTCSALVLQSQRGRCAVVVLARLVEPEGQVGIASRIGRAGQPVRVLAHARADRRPTCAHASALWQRSMGGGPGAEMLLKVRDMKQASQAISLSTGARAFGAVREIHTVRAR